MWSKVSNVPVRVDDQASFCMRVERGIEEIEGFRATRDMPGVYRSTPKEGRKNRRLSWCSTSQATRNLGRSSSSVARSLSLANLTRSSISLLLFHFILVLVSRSVQVESIPSVLCQLRYRNAVLVPGDLGSLLVDRVSSVVPPIPLPGRRAAKVTSLLLRT